MPSLISCASNLVNLVKQYCKKSLWNLFCFPLPFVKSSFGFFFACLFYYYISTYSFMFMILFMKLFEFKNNWRIQFGVSGNPEVCNLYRPFGNSFQLTKNGVKLQSPTNKWNFYSQKVGLRAYYSYQKEFAYHSFYRSNMLYLMIWLYKLTKE